MLIPLLSATQLARSLRDARRAKGLTQKQLADLSGVAQPTISNIERAASRPSFDTVLRLLGCLELELCVQPRPKLDAADLWDT